MLKFSFIKSSWWADHNDKNLKFWLLSANYNVGCIIFDANVLYKKIQTQIYWEERDCSAIENYTINKFLYQSLPDPSKLISFRLVSLTRRIKFKRKNGNGENDESVLLYSSSINRISSILTQISIFMSYKNIKENKEKLNTPQKS